MLNPRSTGEAIGLWLARQGIDNALVAESTVPVASWTFQIDPQRRFPQAIPQAARVEKSSLLQRELALHAGVAITRLRAWSAGGRAFLGVVGPPAKVALRGRLLTGTGLAAPVGLRIDRPVPPDAKAMLDRLTVRIDFAKKGDPHIRVIGSSGTGKTTALLQLVYSLARQNAPEDVRFLVVSNREADWWPLASMRHSLGGRIANENGAAALAWVAEEIRRREVGGLAPYWLFVVVDDCPEMLRLSPEAQPFLAAIARQGRAQRVGLWVAGQSANKDDVGGAAVHANIAANLVLKVPDGDSARRATGLSNTDAHRVGRRGLGMVTVGQAEAVPVVFGLVKADDLADLPQGETWPLETATVAEPRRELLHFPPRNGRETGETGETGAAESAQIAVNGGDSALEAGNGKRERVREMLRQSATQGDIIAEIWQAKPGKGNAYTNATRELRAIIASLV